LPAARLLERKMGSRKRGNTKGKEKGKLGKGGPRRRITVDSGSFQQAREIQIKENKHAFI